MISYISTINLVVIFYILYIFPLFIYNNNIIIGMLILLRTKVKEIKRIKLNIS